MTFILVIAAERFSAFLRKTRRVDRKNFFL